MQSPGYEYTDDGFSILAPSWKDCTPFYTIQTIDKTCLQDGIYMQFRVDHYSYAGDNGSDHRLAFSIRDSQNLNPGSTKYGQGWIGLMYPLTGDVYSHISNTSAFASAGKSDIEAVKDEEGRELCFAQASLILQFQHTPPVGVCFFVRIGKNINNPLIIAEKCGIVYSE